MASQCSCTITNVAFSLMPYKFAIVYNVFPVASLWSITDVDSLGFESYLHLDVKVDIRRRRCSCLHSFAFKTNYENTPLGDVTVKKHLISYISILSFLVA
jgi:hypothetical protein